MTAKWFEVRDSMTFIPALAIAVSGADGYLARRAGFGERCIQLVWISQGLTAYDPYDWTSSTLRVAHRYILEHWDELKDGDVVDVEFVTGKSVSPKRSEQVEYP